jgi:pilus assembly protein CpaF
MNSALSNQLVGSSAVLLPWMLDPNINDILINGVDSFYVESDGMLRREINPFKTREALSDLIERLVFPLARSLDAAKPYLDGRMSDGSRFHIILPPIAVAGPVLSIRKFGKNAERSLSDFGPEGVVDWIKEQIHSRQNLIVSGATGSGKTTLLAQILRNVPSSERIAILEESAELIVDHPHAVRLEARPPSADGKGEVNLQCLLRNALRMRPDRIAIGECRGGEAFDMLQAMNTGHGCFATLHANGALDALKRLEALVLISGWSLSPSAVREWIASNIHAVVHLEKNGGERKISEIIRVQGLEGSVYRILPKYSAKPNRGFLSLGRSPDVSTDRDSGSQMRNYGGGQFGTQRFGI